MGLLPLPNPIAVSIKVAIMADKDENGPSTAAAKVKMQMQKMQEANFKYKNLLKLAKERIQQQDDELKRLKGKANSWALCSFQMIQAFLTNR